MSIQTEFATSSVMRKANYMNRVLSAVAPADAALLAPHLQVVDLPRRHYVERRGRGSDFVYFIDHGVACTIGDELSGHGVEIGMIGPEGFVGMAAAMGAPHCAYDVQLLAAGSARRIPGAVLRAAMNECPSLRAAILGYVYHFMLQVMREAHVNARLKLEARLARWLLMFHDRIEGDEVQLTHDILATMLGVRRAGVSVAAKRLEQRGVLTLHRGAVFIRDRKRLEEASDGAYGASDRSEIRAKT